MKNKKVKVITLLLALLLMLPAMVSAATYKDVDTSHWAYEYITKLSNDRVITGYPDGTYLPNKNVAYLEVLKLLYGVMNPDVEELGKARIAHNTDVVGAGVPDWAQDSVDMALYRDVINVSNLTDAKNANMISNNPVNVPDRQTIAMYFAKALGMSESDDFTVLKHKDVNEIPEINKKYLVPLVKAGIFDPTGSDGNFEGRRGIRRAEMAKITYLAHEYMKKYGLELTMEGKVIIEPRKDTNVFFIEKKDGNAESFGFDKDTKFTLNGKEIKAEDVKEGQEAKVTYVKTDSHQSGKLAKKVELKTDEIPAVGYVLTVMDKALEVNYAENVIDVKYDTKDSVKVDKKGVFILAKDAKITRYDKTIELKDVKVNDFVEFTLKDNQITGIKVIPQNFEITGELVKIDDRKADDKFAEVTLKLSDKKEHVFYVEKIAGSQGQYFGQKYNVNGLESKKIGENVTFTLKYKLIEKLG
ncbi:MAG: S-layer homology domain-containing protein, partial [Tissierellia bacterium]|nr:S-layer homology domain-containing protein [Tissierellia bacterium]